MEDKESRPYEHIPKDNVVVAKFGRNATKTTVGLNMSQLYDKALAPDAPRELVDNDGGTLNIIFSAPLQEDKRKICQTQDQELIEIIMSFWEARGELPFIDNLEDMVYGRIWHESTSNL